MDIELRPETKQALDNIVDTFTCSDGGGKFVMMRNALIALDKQACNGDTSAQKLIELFTRFSKFIDLISIP